MPERIHYADSDQYIPLSPWAHVGYSILFALPVLGLIFLIVFSFDGSNINRRNFARSYWCWLVVVIVAAAVFAGSGGFGLLYSRFRAALDTIGSSSSTVTTALDTLRTALTGNEKPPVRADSTVRPTSRPTGASTAAPLAAAASSTARPAAEPAASPTAAPTARPASGGVNPQFKAVMDSYEAFFGEYAAFMKRYEDNDHPIGMLADYLDYLAKYVDAMEALDEIEEDDLSAADWAYYLEVHARILRKLEAAAE